MEGMNQPTKPSHTGIRCIEAHPPAAIHFPKFLGFSLVRPLGSVSCHSCRTVIKAKMEHLLMLILISPESIPRQKHVLQLCNVTDKAKAGLSSREDLKEEQGSGEFFHLSAWEAC